MDRHLMFLIVSFVCMWLVLDFFYGKKYVGTFVASAIPKSEKKSLFPDKKKDEDEDEDEDEEDEGDE